MWPFSSLRPRPQGPATPCCAVTSGLRVPNSPTDLQFLSILFDCVVVLHTFQQWGLSFHPILCVLKT